MSRAPFKPTKAELAAAASLTVPDLIADKLDVLFCGINPGLYTAAIQHHFGRPGNRFWPALYGAGFTPRLFTPWEEFDLLALRIGITNMVERTSATAAEVSPEEFVLGGQRLTASVARSRPRVVAFLGIGAYRQAFSRPKAVLGLQTEMLGASALWVLPSPSGLNANHQLPDLIVLFGELRAWVQYASHNTNVCREKPGVSRPLWKLMPSSLRSFDEFDALLATTRETVHEMRLIAPDDGAILTVQQQLDALHAWTRGGRCPAPDEKDQLNFGAIASRELDDYPIAPSLYELASYVMYW